MRPWPSRRNRILVIRFSLVSGFDGAGNVVYVDGTIESERERAIVQSLLQSLPRSRLSIRSVTMGEVHLDLEDGSTVTLRPVFHPSRRRYGDLLFTDDAQYPMPEELAELLERWRSLGT